MRNFYLLLRKYFNFQIKFTIFENLDKNWQSEYITLKK